MTKLCTCRSAAERACLSLCVYVYTEFVSGSPPPLAAAVLERPRHECDERLTSEEQTDTVSGERGREKWGTFPPELGRSHAQTAIFSPVRPYVRPSVRTGHTHTCERAARRAVCAIRCLSCIRRAARLIDKMQGEGSCMWSITCTSPATCTRLCTGTRGHALANPRLFVQSEI